jgi:methylated-DNA-protein-cysteine methyltransferase related protein
MSAWDPVYKLVQRIPRGKLLTYGAVAKALKLVGGARSAGRAMAACPSGKGIPWHRVLGANGKILIREPHSNLQRKLLESEGVEVVENRVRIKNYLWNPPKPKKSMKSRKPAKRS